MRIQKNNKSQAKFKLSPLAVAIATSLAMPSNADAADIYWNATAGNWADANNWNVSLRPNLTDLVTLGSADSSILLGPATINEASNLSNPAQAGSLNIQNFTVYQTDGQLTVSNTESYSAGQFIQSGGYHDVFKLNLNQGAYVLKSGTLHAQNELVGPQNIGTFIQYGGLNAVTGNVDIGGFSTFSAAIVANGYYELDGGLLQVNGTETIGFGVKGSFVQNGGDNLANALVLGNGTSISRYFYPQPLLITYTLNGGLLDTSSEIIATGDLYSSSSASFDQYAGTNNINGSLILGASNYSVGIYNFTDGFLHAENEVVGNLGEGEFVQKAGVHTVNGSIILGEKSGSTGSFFLQGGSLAVHSLIKGQGTANFDWSGGNLHYTSDLILQDNSSDIFGKQLDMKAGLGFQVPNLTVAQAGQVNQVDGIVKIDSSLTVDGNYQLDNGILSVGNDGSTGVELIGKTNNGNFIQKGGLHTVNGIIVLGATSVASGNFSLQGGTLTTQGIYKGDGNASFNWTGGTLYYTSDLSIQDNSSDVFGSQFAMSAGRAFQAPNMTIATEGVVTQSGGSITVDSVLQMDGRYDLNGGLLKVGNVVNGYEDGVLNNNGEFNLAGGNLQGGVANNALMTGYGTITSSSFYNLGLFTQGAGNLKLKAEPQQPSNIYHNSGNMVLAGGRQLILDAGVNLYNTGNLDLNSGIVTGSGFLTNWESGVVSGRGTISSGFQNIGTLSVDSGKTQVNQLFTNNGLIQLNASSANLYAEHLQNGYWTWQYDDQGKGYYLWYRGTIQGHGQVGGVIENFHTSLIEAREGTLTLAGNLTNQGTLAASNGAKLLVTQGLATNSGDISLEGGNFDNNNHTLVNAGRINGYGILRTGGLSNQGQMTLAGGNSIVNGDVSNQNNATITVAHSQVLFTDAVVNNGLFKNTGGAVTFADGYTENGVYFSDPAVNNFSSTLTIGTSGYLLGGLGDQFHLRQDFVNHSLMNTAWNTDQAALFFDGGISQSFYLAGADLGTTGNGFANNFAWGSLTLGSGSTLNLVDGNANSGAALYVHDINLGGSVDFNTMIVSSIFGGFNIYYNMGSSVNAYLHGATFNFAGGGKLIGVQVNAVPLPAAFWLFGSSIFGVLVLGCKKMATNTI